MALNNTYGIPLLDSRSLRHMLDKGVYRALGEQIDQCQQMARDASSETSQEVAAVCKQASDSAYKITEKPFELAGVGLYDIAYRTCLKNCTVGSIP